MKQMNLSMKQKENHGERIVVAAKGWGLGRGKLLYTGRVNSKVLLHSTGSYIQYPMINHNGKEYLEGECICS